MKRHPENHTLLAFGANLPLGGLSPQDLIRRALSVMAEDGLEPLRVSALYRTPCFPAGAGPDYVNAAACIAVPEGLSPDALLARLHRIEARLGRTRSVRWGGRTIDIDLLAIGDLVLPDAAEQGRWRGLDPAEQGRLAPDRLILPHPRMQDRAFVLVPLAEIAPDWVHPVLSRTVTEMLAALPEQDRDAVRKLD